MSDQYTPSVDDLAQEIRQVDGSHSLGAGALSEALAPWLTTFKRDTEIALLERLADEIDSESAEWFGETDYADGHRSAFDIAATIARDAAYELRKDAA